ncbi:hypothetical protein TBLA_0J02030 [Henningerozyma blattae CBS 6284]|uniref:EF-hand domain-containing protein n=1 Tax=Henningerozyma blattae (strain ATCC 34711 / CBS 6284 / DSM 70876 / NBRC 10599 / NRRL Y-10934 / UCD 77-7) TaxID=1071380 RepID=I2H9Z5_HENB6|nr:hypothetical protein TBLA_0J02030 [Tetrapisispora blattae CBS 6284]CCH63197.1 hypothetical protein TBLA_0J02030 [Tetrapisispora blattae CBS 6284]
MIRREIETETQRELRLRKIFKDLDVNDSGLFNVDDLKTAFHRMDHPLKDNDEAIKELFGSMDINNNGFINYQEFEKFSTLAESQIELGFNQIDQDKDGIIKPSEIYDYLRQFEDNTLGKESRFVGIKTPKDPKMLNFLHWAFKLKGNDNIDRDSHYITYNQWRDFLLLMPRQKGSRIHAALGYYYLFKEDVDLSSEGDMTLINDFINGFGFFLAGGVSGVVSRTCTAPFDRIKIFLIARTDLSSILLNSKEQVLAHNPHANVQKIRSPIIKAAVSLYREGGLKSFYVGNGLNVLKVFPESSMKFGSFEICKSIMASLEGKKDKSSISKLSTYIAGGLAGMVAQFTIYPIDTLKFRMQCAPLHNDVKGNALLLKTMKDLYREGGLSIFYRGITVGLLGIFPYAAFDLGTFTALKKWYIKREALRTGSLEENVTLKNTVVLPMGAFSGSVGACIVYPINLCRTRLQTQGTFAHPYHYTGFRDVFVQTLKREGYQGLYKGLTPTLAKVCPAVSISYLCYENIKRALNLEK